MNVATETTPDVCPKCKGKGGWETGPHSESCHLCDGTGQIKPTPDGGADDYFKEWTCTFPGKMGLSWKRAWHGVGTKAEAELQATKNCNVAAIPLDLFVTMKDHERRMVEAEREADALRSELAAAKAELAAANERAEAAVKVVEAAKRRSELSPAISPKGT